MNRKIALCVRKVAFLKSHTLQTSLKMSNHEKNAYSATFPTYNSTYYFQTSVCLSVLYRPKANGSIEA